MPARVVKLNLEDAERDEGQVIKGRHNGEGALNRRRIQLRFRGYDEQKLSVGRVFAAVAACEVGQPVRIPAQNERVDWTQRGVEGDF